MSAETNHCHRRQAVNSTIERRLYLTPIMPNCDLSQRYLKDSSTRPDALVQTGGEARDFLNSSGQASPAAPDEILEEMNANLIAATSRGSAKSFALWT
jgi:hypothetical protein